MKLFSKKRLQINEKNSKTIIRWWVLNAVEIMLLVLLIIAFIWGLGSYNKSDEIIGLKVLPMDAEAAFVYWTIWTLIFAHMIFNRFVVLEISSEYLKYKRRFIFGVNRNINIKNIVEMQIEEKAENIAESPPDGMDLTSYNLLIYSSYEQTIKIKGLSKPDIKIIQKKIGEYMN